MPAVTAKLDAGQLQHLAKEKSSFGTFFVQRIRCVKQQDLEKNLLHNVVRGLGSKRILTAGFYISKNAEIYDPQLSSFSFQKALIEFQMQLNVTLYPMRFPLASLETLKHQSQFFISHPDFSLFWPNEILETLLGKAYSNFENPQLLSVNTLLQY